MLRRLAPLIPYAAVGVGVYLASSAWIAILLYHVGAMAVARSLPRETASERPSPRRGTSWLAAALIIGAALVGPAIYFAWDGITLPSGTLDDTLVSLGLNGATWIAFAIYYATVNPVVEEVFWRRYLLTPERHAAGNDLWFAGYHVLVLVRFVQPIWVAVATAILAIAAWLWRQLGRELGLIAPITSHVIADASLILAVSALRA